MKKIFLAFALILVLTSFWSCSCESSTDVHNHDHGHIHEEQTTQEINDTEETQAIQEVTGAAEPQTTPEIKADASGPLASKHSQKIDVPYEDEYAQAASDEERISISDKYRKEWEKIGQRYYKENIHYIGGVPVHPDFSTDKEMHEYVEFRKGDFDSYYNNECKTYLAQMEKEHGKGSKANALCANYKYDLQRSFALEMIEIYELLGEFNGQVF